MRPIGVAAWTTSLLAVVILMTDPACAGAPSMKLNMPPEILSKREIILSTARYQELAQEWRTYVDDNPKSAVAHVQLARALRYAATATPEEMNALVREAVELDPDCPEALDALADTGLHAAKPLVTLEEAVRDARRAAELAPDWTYPRFTLWSHLIVLDRPQEAAEELRAIRAKGGFPSPLLDFNYNLLVSADPDAVVFTNGDNDTYPALALQAALGTRKDVAIVNLSLLNHIGYAKAVWKWTFGKNAPFSEKEIARLMGDWKDDATHRGGDTLFSTVVMQAMMEKVRTGRWSKPVYFALTVAPSHLEACGQRLEIEGILLRVQKTRRSEGEECCDYSLALEKTLRLFRGEFRLDSATDLAYPWTPESAIRRLMTNYAAVLRIAATESAKQRDLDAVRYALGTGIEIVDFQGYGELVRKMAAYWKELDPDNPAVDSWMER